jgi:CYTH domain-containing protein
MSMLMHHRYARIERERRFLLRGRPFAQPSVGRPSVRVRRITDRYIEGTNLRLREQKDESGPPAFKLTQKIPAPGSAAQQGYITTMYLDRDTHERLSQLSAKVLAKTRYSVPPFGIDVFEGVLEGLVLAEAEFDSEAEADALAIPDFIAHEVSSDARFTGGYLVHASRRDLETWLSDYGLVLTNQRERRG